MNNTTMDYLMRKVGSNRDSRGRDYTYESTRGRYGRGNVDFEDSMDFKNTRHSEDWVPDERYDTRNYEDARDMRDYHKAPKLSKTDIHHWKQMMENEDGTHGAHFDMQQIMSVVDKLDIHFKDFDEREFCIAVNMMYSDYCKVARKYVSPDKELVFFAELAKAFLEDADGPEASEKLALYFHCIVDA